MEVECPVCAASFPPEDIESHAAECVEARFGKSNDVGSNGRDTSPTLSRKRKVSPNKQPLKLHNATGSTSSSQSPAPKKSRQQQEQAWSFLYGTSKNSAPEQQTHRKGDGEATQSADRGGELPPPPPSLQPTAPLAERMRPASLEEYIGQEAVLSNNSFLRTLLEQGNFINMILWGPPGCGKTSLANVVKERCRAEGGWVYSSLSACTSGLPQVRKVVQEAQSARQLRKKRTLLFMDEVHRFNKLQQDVFLPHVESGLLTLIGATTENPSFTLNSALLSRCKVLILKALTPASVRIILRNALERLKVTVVKDQPPVGKEKGEELNDEAEEEEQCGKEEPEDSDLEEEESLGEGSASLSCPKISEAAVGWLSELSGGDARCALNTLQHLLEVHPSTTITTQHAKEALQRSHVLYDKTGEEHYNFASALQKSIRGSDDNAALYWTIRMIQGGEDPRFIARRLIRTAAEDIGLGTPEAVEQAVAAMQAVQMVGLPECDVVLAQCAVYLARAKKNPEVYLAMRKVREHIETHAGPLPSVPLHLRNASTRLMKELGYGRGYSMDPRNRHDIKYLPKELEGVNFFKS